MSQRQLAIILFSFLGAFIAISSVPQVVLSTLETIYQQPDAESTYRAVAEPMKLRESVRAGCTERESRA
jgi:hypothetical protein